MQSTGQEAGDGRTRLWRGWLTAVGLGLVVFGTGMALLGGTPVFSPLHALIDPAFWPGEPSDAGAVAFRAWAYGVWGAALVGWGVAIAFLAREALGRGEAWAWRALAIGTVLWFVLDTSVSALHGVWANVGINLVVMALVAVPLVATRASGRR